jgi:hypothetical protein
MGMPVTNSFEVYVTTLDNLVFKGGLPPPTKVKIDVEGFECEVLTGAKRVLENYAPDLYIELHDTTAEQIAATAGARYDVTQQDRWCICTPTP